ncbi:DNA polymerase kappa isoform X1 [Erpetoichthys calabaricus]|uniref:DNA polymerase kappa isoform X1 n=1 Tax=Erpetoichthys calabaricus TaxID=27687 RepID=UPI002234D3FA|nr:DNA polymerase kappa isoform X1 [Erpetoichthys calabaricus]
MENNVQTASTGGGFQPWMAVNDNKAGMEGLDKEKINRIILEASKGSKFYENELKKEQQVNQRIEKMMQQKELITVQQLRKAQLLVDKLVNDLECSRDLGRIIVHIDMDAFYAAVEMRDNLDLRDKPMAVGSMSMLSTSNYHARKFGVRAAMPGFIAKKLCPSLIIVPLNFDKYKAVSAEIREIFAEYDPNFSPVSLDEAYLDITDHLEQRCCWPESRRTYYLEKEITSTEHTSDLQLSGNTDGTISPVLFEDSPPPSLNTAPEQKHIVFGISAEEAVREMRFRIEQKTSLTASAGIAPNTMLAKVCSDKNKPNGQYKIPNNQQAVMDFIKDLPIRKVPGIGKVTEKMLKALGITTCSELRQQGALLSLLFSETSWHHFLQISLGLGSTHLERDGERKSMSTERTFSEISDPEEQYSLCRELCSDLAKDLKKEGLRGRTVTLKLKNVNFALKTKASTLSYAVSTEDEIFALAKDLLKTEIDNSSPQPLRLRLMGVRISGFQSQEDKKQQQKSILGFLHTDKQDIPFTSQGHMFSTQGTKASCSFFNRKKAELMLNDQKQNPQEHQTCNVGDRDVHLINGSNGLLNCMLTCPVCLMKQNTSDLKTFNEHIDKCLSSVSEGQEDTNDKTQKASNLPICDDKNEIKIFCESDINESVHCNSSNVMSTSCHNVKDKMTRIVMGNTEEESTAEESSPLIHNSVGYSRSCSKESTTQSNVTDLCEMIQHKQDYKQKSSSLLTRMHLLCPVCNLKQETSDLDVFNRHVDVCLNEGVLKELVKERPCSSDAVSLLDRKTTAAHLDVNSRNKSKRSASPPLQHAAKKPKHNKNENTIYRFFR